MDILGEAFDWLSQFPEDLQLDMIATYAKERGMSKLLIAIITYWENEQEESNDSAD